MDERSEQHAVDELDAAADYRRQADKEMSMSERLAALHELCKQLAAVDGTAKQEDGASIALRIFDGSSDERT